MNFEIKTEGFKLTPETRSYVEEKLRKLTRYYRKIESIHLWLKSGKEQHSDKKFHASGLVHLPGKVYLRGSESGRIPEEAVDLLSENLERQIERHSRKV